ncbi:MAG: hypothetical protein ACP5TL_01630 [Candidatus Micrarchaeia archaeon]
MDEKMLGLEEVFAIIIIVAAMQGFLISIIESNTTLSESARDIASTLVLNNFIDRMQASTIIGNLTNLLDLGSNCLTYGFYQAKSYNNGINRIIVQNRKMLVVHCNESANNS